MLHRSNRPRALKTLLAVQPWRVKFVLLAGSAYVALAAPQHSSSFSGAAALAATRKAVSFGERPSGSEAIRRLRDWIVSEMKPLGGQLDLDSFTAQTPTGAVPMVNLILKFPGTSGKAVVVTGHYDTKRIPMVQFVGANDAGSSTGLLMEFARVMSHLKHSDDIYIVFFDGEEAVVSWTDIDSLYGSRHLAAKWAADGTLSRIKALINVDMIGDKDLDISDDENSSESLRAMVWQIAEKLGYSKYFRHDPGGVDDDHKPFVNSGVNAIDIIDLDYGPRSPQTPNGAYWHTAEDTLDKLSAHSFQVVGDILVELVKEVEKI